jgi:Sec-independent protein translocase protein TatA
MDLQNTFYIVGIIYMTLYTLLLIAVIILLLYIKKKVTELTDNIQEKVETIQDMASHPKETAASIRAAVAQTAFEKVSKSRNVRKKR